MLTISLDRLGDLLEKAAEIDLILPVPTDDDEAGTTAVEQMTVEDVVADAEYQDLLQSLKALPPNEQYELLALGLLGRNDAGADEWQAMLEQARALQEEDILEEVARIILLTDEIETALDHLGIDLDNDDDEPSEEGPEEEEEEE